MSPRVINSLPFGQCMILNNIPIVKAAIRAIVILKNIVLRKVLFFSRNKRLRMLVIKSPKFANIVQTPFPVVNANIKVTMANENEKIKNEI